MTSQARPYITEKMLPSEMMRAYCLATWGRTDRDLVDAVVGATGDRRFRPGQVRRWKVEPCTRPEQRQHVLAWMEWSDLGLASHAAGGVR